MIKKIAVIGAGTMGHAVAEAFAMHGYNVNIIVRETSKQKDTVLDTIKNELELFYHEGVIPQKVIQQSLDRLTVVTDLQKGCEDRDYIIECLPEVLKLKQETFKLLDGYCPSHTIFSSNTSSLRLGDVMASLCEERKRRTMIAHWYNPAHIIPIAELSYFGNMSEEIYKEVEELYQSIGKQTIKVLKEVPGLVANRMGWGLAREAFALVEEGVASAEDIDKALKFGPGFRYATTGQLEISDFGGLDIWCTVGDNLLKEISNAQEASDILKQKVNEGNLGTKTGKGFYDYSGPKKKEALDGYIRRLITQLKASEYYK